MNTGHTPNSDVCLLRTFVGGDESNQERNSLQYHTNTVEKHIKKIARLSGKMKVAGLTLWP